MILKVKFGGKNWLLSLVLHWRFDEAVKAAQRAAKIDANNREIATMMRRTQAVASARSKGNDHFKASKFREASLAYGEGLDHDPSNAVLLCNRAASRSKLSQWEKAVEDCDTALRLRPSYAKARLRRAYCYAKVTDMVHVLNHTIEKREFLQNCICCDSVGEMGSSSKRLWVTYQRIARKWGGEQGASRGQGHASENERRSC